MDNYHLTKQDDQWKLSKEGAKRASAAYGDATKAEALKQAAQTLAGSGGSLKIHKENGVIQEERTFPRKADPRRSKG
jgi:hypothetical protein